MKAIIDLTITLTLLLGSGAIAKKVYKEVQVIAVKRIQKGLIVQALKITKRMNQGML